MKTLYWLVATAAVAAAGVTLYTRLTAGDPPLPNVPTVADTPRDVPQIPLPPIVMPPDEPLAMPPAPDTPAAPMPLPSSMRADNSPKPVGPSVPVPTIPTVPPMTSGPVVPASAMIPLPPLPATSAARTASDPPFEPLVLPTTKPPELPLPPSTPPVQSPPSVVPPSPPTPYPLPSGPSPVLQPPVPAKPLPLPAAVGDPGAREPLAVLGKFVVLKDDKLIEGAVSVNNDTVIVRQGALDRPFPKGQVQFVAADKDEVYRFMLAKVPANDVAARLKVARWCMFSGLREQALTEAREVQKLQPNNSSAADMVRSLELSLQQFPVENAAKMTAPPVPTFPAELAPAPVRPIPPAAVADPEPDVSPEAALVFGARVQPFLANQCVECHAKADFAGKFKLVRVTPTDAGPQATRTNLRAVAGQLRKDDPAASPLLLKSISAHGGMKLPAVESRQAAAYLGLEWWVALAVGTPVAPAVPAAPAPPVSPVPPIADPVLPPPAPPVLPVLPVNPPAPIVPPADPFPNPPLVPAPQPLPGQPPLTDPLLPPPLPVGPAPQPKPVVPALPPSDPFPPILPPSSAPKPVAPPVIPPVIQPIPPATAAPKPPSPVVPVGGSQFGSAIPPKPPVTGPSGDEFDPANFNALPPRK